MIDEVHDLEQEEGIASASRVQARNDKSRRSPKLVDTLVVGHSLRVANQEDVPYSVRPKVTENVGATRIVVELGSPCGETHGVTRGIIRKSPCCLRPILWREAVRIISRVISTSTAIRMLKPLWQSFASPIQPAFL